jgi:hypothetical protein
MSSSRTREGQMHQLDIPSNTESVYHVLHHHVHTGELTRDLDVRSLKQLRSDEKY